MKTTTINKSRFNEILIEELEALRKHLTDTQMSLLCGPSLCTEVALNEISNQRDVAFSHAHDMAAHRQRQKEHDDAVRFSISQSEAHDLVRHAFAERNSRIADFNNPKEWEVQNSLTVVILGLWDDIKFGDGTWDDLGYARQFKLKQLLNDVFIVDEDQQTLINTWDIVKSFVKLKDAGDAIRDLPFGVGHGIISLRDWIADSDLLRWIEGILAIAGIGLLAAGAVPAAGITLTAGAYIAISRGVAQMSKANSAEEAFEAFFNILIGATLKGGAGGASFWGQTLRGTEGFGKALLTMDAAALAAWFTMMKKQYLPEAAASTLKKIAGTVWGLVKLIFDAMLTHEVIVTEWDNATRPPPHWVIPDNIPWGFHFFEDYLSAKAREDVTIDDIDWASESGVQISPEPSPEEQQAVWNVATAIENGDVTLKPDNTVTINNTESPEAVDIANDLTTLGIGPAPSDDEIQNALQKAEQWLNMDDSDLNIIDEQFQGLSSQIFNSSRLQLLADI